MIKDRTTQLIYQTIYCTLGVVACVASLGIFDNINLIRWDFYVHFTNISNYFCLGIMFAELIQTARKDKDGYVTVLSISWTGREYRLTRGISTGFSMAWRQGFSLPSQSR